MAPHPELGVVVGEPGQAPFGQPGAALVVDTGHSRVTDGVVGVDLDPSPMGLLHQEREGIPAVNGVEAGHHGQDVRRIVSSAAVVKTKAHLPAWGIAGNETAHSGCRTLIQKVADHLPVSLGGKHAIVATDASPDGEPSRHGHPHSTLNV